MSLGPVVFKCLLLQMYRNDVFLCGRHGQEQQYCVFKNSLMLWEVLLSLKPHYPLRPSRRRASQKRFKALLLTSLYFEEETAVLFAVVQLLLLVAESFSDLRNHKMVS